LNYLKKIQAILSSERGVAISVELIALSVAGLIIAAVIYNAVMPNTKALHNGMVNRVKDVTATGF